MGSLRCNCQRTCLCEHASLSCSEPMVNHQSINSQLTHRPTSTQYLGFPQEHGSPIWMVLLALLVAVATCCCCMVGSLLGVVGTSKETLSAPTPPHGYMSICQYVLPDCCTVYKVYTHTQGTHWPFVEIEMHLQAPTASQIEQVTFACLWV